MRTKTLLLVIALLFSLPTVEAAPSISASPASGSGSVSPVLTWSCDAGSTASASGGWSGAKAVSGSQSAGPITATTTYTIHCTPAAAVDLSWTVPTQNTDNSPLTDLAGYRVYSGASAGSLSLLATVANPATVTYRATGLGAGTSYFAVSAYTATAESALSNVGSKTVAAPAVQSASVTVTVTSVPKPPILTVAVVAGMNMSPVYKLTTTGKRSAEPAGFVPVGTACEGNVLFRYREVSYRRVDPALVIWWGEIVPSDRVAAACG